MSVAALVVSYQTGSRLKECLYALRADPQVDEIILVDNGNPPDMTAWLERFFAREDSGQLITPGVNLGFGAGVNLAARQAEADDLLVINPDALLRWESIEPMIEVARGAAEPCIVGGRIFDIRGREERGCRRRELTLTRAMTRLVGWNTWTLEHTPPPEGPVRMDVISGAFFLMSRDGFQQLGGFDEGYFLHVEDIDLCRRARAMGGEVWYQPQAGALHFGATSDVPSRTVAKHKADSLARYFRKFSRGPLHRIAVEMAIPFIKLITVLRSA